MARITIHNDIARTPDEARDSLNRRGESATHFARRHGVSLSTVSAVLTGQNKGLRGDAHRAAVALGIKVGVAEIEVPDGEAGERAA